MRHVFQIVGVFNYRSESIEDVRGQYSSLEEAQNIMPDLCKIFSISRGNDSFSSTFYIREVWTDSTYKTSLSSKDINFILHKKYYDRGRY